MDATIKGRTLSAQEIAVAIEEILRTPINDGVELSVSGIEEIREESDYPGYRVSIGTVLDKTCQTLKIDTYQQKTADNHKATHFIYLVKG